MKWFFLLLPNTVFLSLSLFILLINFLFTGRNESNFNKNIFVADVRNLALIREECPVNLLNKVKNASVVYTYGNDEN